MMGLVLDVDVKKLKATGEGEYTVGLVKSCIIYPILSFQLSTSFFCLSSEL